VTSPKLQVGDYVLVVEHRKIGTFKLQVKWKGPRRIASAENDYVFVEDNLLTKAAKQHACDSKRIIKLNITQS
jgi:hypothetical protein